MVKIARTLPRACVYKIFFVPLPPHLNDKHQHKYIIFLFNFLQ